MNKKVGSKGQAVVPLNDSDRDEIKKIVSIALTITRTLFDTLAATDVAIDNKLTYVVGLIPENVLNADEWQILVDKTYERGRDEAYERRADPGGDLDDRDQELATDILEYLLESGKIKRVYNTSVPDQADEEA